MNLKWRTDAERSFDAQIGRHIAAFRKARGMPRVKLAAALGIDYRRLYWIETGGRCSLYLAVQISMALDVNLPDLARTWARNSVLLGKTKESHAAGGNSVLGSESF